MPPDAAPQDAPRPSGAFHPDSIPAELRGIDRWVAFKLLPPKKPGDKWRKVPVDAKTGNNASSTDPQTWSSFDRAKSRAEADDLPGVGFVFNGDGITGIDLDDARDPATGVIDPGAQQIINALASYTEVSPSGTGVHTLVRGKLPPSGRRKGKFEVYETERFFTVTGDRVPGTPATIEARQSELDRLHAETFAANPKKGGKPSETRDEWLLRRAREAKNGPKFIALWDGNTTGYSSASEADLALCNHLSFASRGNAEDVDRLFRQSKLMRPKWDEQHGDRTYGQMTVAKAIEPKHGRVRRVDVVPGKLPEAVREANDLLAGISPPEFFQRDGALIRLVRLPEASETHGVTRPNGAVTLSVVEEHYLGLRLTELAEWWVPKRDGIAQADAPKAVVQKLLASSGRWTLPQLIGVVEAPTLRADGSILDQPGYDAKSRVFFDSGGVDFGTIVQNPTREQAEAALKYLLEPFSQFPFVAESDRSALAAALLTGVVRRSLPTAPMFLFDARTMGTGKSLLADSVSIVATGRPCSVMTQGANEAEDKKRCFSILLQGDAVASIDNVDRPIGSVDLCAILTQEMFQDRILGSSKVIKVPSRTLWLATGNNLVVVGDLITRIVVCDLDAKCEAPQKREFQNDLKAELVEKRPMLVRAALTVMRAFIVAGRPKQDVPVFGRFEKWSRFVREALVWLDMPDPLGGVDRLVAQDPITTKLSALMDAWSAKFGSQPTTVADAVRSATTRGDTNLHDALFEIAGFGSDGIDCRAVGRFISSHRGRLVGGRSFEAAGQSHKVVLWVVKGGSGGSFQALRESSKPTLFKEETGAGAHVLEGAESNPPNPPNTPLAGPEGTSCECGHDSPIVIAKPHGDENRTFSVEGTTDA